MRMSNDHAAARPFVSEEGRIDFRPGSAMTASMIASNKGD
jgi:hypothetical protein